MPELQISICNVFNFKVGRREKIVIRVREQAKQRGCGRLERVKIDSEVGKKRR